MVNHDLFSKFQDRFIDKQLEITYDGGTITNSELFAESMQLTESLCSDSQLKFGSCEASVIKFKIANVFLPMFGKQITVTMYLDGNRDKPFQIGIYKVASDTPTADRKWRNIVAYDAMYDMLNADVSDWYNKVLPNKDSMVTLKEFRTSFIQHFGLDQEDITLINDKMIVEKTIEPSELSGKTVITCICEINGCFGHIGRDGKFQWIYLTQGIGGLYPTNDLYPANDLYPRDPKSTAVGQNGSYTDCKYSDFVTRTITKLQIRASENDIGAISGDDADNCYIIEDNFLVYGKGKDEFQPIADNIMSRIKGITYRPFDATVQGNPCYEVGDAVRLFTKYELIESYILSRTLKGIQALRDSFTTKGEERYGEKVNSVRNSIIQLKGKTNELERNVEETRSTITDVQKGLQSEITQTADSIKSEVSATYQTKSDAKTSYENLNSSITQTADSITAEVSRAKSSESTLKSSIEVNANAITTKVSKGSISSEISQEAGKITINSNRFELHSTNLDISADGKLTVKGNGTITGVTINGSTFYSESSGGTYVKIANGIITGGRSGVEAGKLDFGETLDGERSLAIRAQNLTLCASKFAIGESKDQYSGLAVASQTYDCKYVVQIINNGDGSITWTTSVLKIRNGIVVAH